MSLCGSHPHQLSEVAMQCWYHVHSSLRASVEFWNRRNLNEFPAMGAWVSQFTLYFYCNGNDISSFSAMNSLKISRQLTRISVPSISLTPAA